MVAAGCNWVKGVPALKYQYQTLIGSALFFGACAKVRELIIKVSLKFLVSALKKNKNNKKNCPILKEIMVTLFCFCCYFFLGGGVVFLCRMMQPFELNVCDCSII